MKTGVRVYPPGECPFGPGKTEDVWTVTILCPCRMFGSVVVRGSQVRTNKMDWEAEHFAFDTLKGEGWSIEPPRCPVCNTKPMAAP